MTVEITPQGNAPRIARELLAVAEADPRFTVNDVKTTTFGPLGLAFLVPDELHDAWTAAHLAPEPAADADADTPRRGRGRTRKTETSEE